MCISNYFPICDVIVLLMQPLVEVVVHDLATDKICYIKGGLSKRSVGEPSHLMGQELEAGIDKIVYSKVNFDGRLIKSISVPIESNWLMCINCDVSVFNQMKNFSEQFLKLSHETKPGSLFKNDWQEKLHLSIHSYIQDKSWSFNNLNTNQKKDLVKYLFDNEAFYEKNAAAYVANILHMGRATIFKYLKAWRMQ